MHNLDQNFNPQSCISKNIIYLHSYQSFATNCQIEAYYNINTLLNYLIPFRSKNMLVK